MNRNLTGLARPIPQHEPTPPPLPSRVCGNRANRAQRYKIGNKWHTAEHCGRERCDGGDRCPCRCAGCLGAERAGCPNPAAQSEERIPGLSRLGLCEECRDEQRALAPRVRDHEAALDTYEPVPGLCGHGQRPGFNCGACQT